MRDFTLQDIELLLDRKLEQKLEQHYQSHKDERRLEMQQVFDENFESVIIPLFDTVEERFERLELRLDKLEANLNAKMDIFMEKVVDHEVRLRKARI